MRDFILVRDALTDKLMIIRKSMICSVEECLRDNKLVRRISYVDCRTPEYVSDSLINIMHALEEGINDDVS